jgi:hypothetical protein
VRLLPTSKFAARLASPPSDTELPSSELLLDGRPSGLIVTGAVLETALEWQGCSIVFFTDDIPYEDMLRIYMFDANLTLADSAVLGSRYSTGTFAELNLLPPNSLTFRLAPDIARQKGICPAFPFRPRRCESTVQILPASPRRRQTTTERGMRDFKSA